MMTNGQAPARLGKGPRSFTEMAQRRKDVADRDKFNLLLKAMAQGEPLPKGTFPEAEKSSRKRSGARYGDARLAQASP
jgi:hypothetical protein